MQSENSIVLLFYIFLSHGNGKKGVGCKKGGCCVLSTSTNLSYSYMGLPVCALCKIAFIIKTKSNFLILFGVFHFSITFWLNLFCFSLTFICAINKKRSDVNWFNLIRSKLPPFDTFFFKCA